MPDGTVDDQEDLCQASRAYNTDSNNEQANRLAEASKQVKLNLHQEAEEGLQVFSPKILEKPIVAISKNGTNQ